jgi:hypothetical protein
LKANGKISFGPPDVFIHGPENKGVFEREPKIILKNTEQSTNNHEQIACL